MLTDLNSMQKSQDPTSSTTIMHWLRKVKYDRILQVLLVAVVLLFGVADLTMFQAFAQQAPLGPHQLDQLVSRIALYPDPLLAQVLTASTYWTEIPEAAAWADDHSYLKGDALSRAIQEDNLPWDASVLALLPFPSVLDMMAKDPAWTEQLGNAVLTQRADVMDAVQRMRHKATDYGYLQSNGYMRVVTDGGYIEILEEEKMTPCTHLDQIRPGKPHTQVCEECLKMGDDWVHLRLYSECGNVGCCDSSKNKHATKHFHRTKHPIMKSFEPGENWGWCYVDQVELNIA